MKLKVCKSCRQPFIPTKPMQSCCGPTCAINHVKANKAKAAMKAAKESRKKDRERREKLKTRADYMREAQREFNAFIRARDAGKPCICCGKVMDWTGNKVDAGHYRSTGSAPHLRFSEDNCHAQDKQCNRWGAGRAVDYRIGLIARIGLRQVENLEANQEPRKWSIEELKAIRDEYRKKRKEMIEYQKVEI